MESNRTLIPIIIGGSYNGYGIIRSFAEKKIKSILITHGEKAFAKASKYVEKTVILTSPDVDEGRFVQELFEFGQNLHASGLRGIIFPTHDEDVIAISKNKNKLEVFFDIPFSGWDVCSKIMDKTNFAEVCKKIGVPTIPEKLIYSFEEGLALLNSLNLPLFIKANIWDVNLVIIFGGKNVVFYEKDKFIDYIKKYFKYCPGGSLLVQKYIEESNVLNPNINCVSDKNGNIVAVHFGEKIRQYPPKTGTSTAFRSIDINTRKDMDIILDYAKRIMSEFKFYGLSGIEFLYDSKEKSYRVIEMNLRSEFTNYLQLVGGQNMPYYLYKYCKNEDYTIPYFTPKPYYTIFVPFNDRFYALHLNKIKDEDYCLSKREWRNSLGKKHEKYGLTPKDIKAYISEYKRLVWSGINAFLRKKNDIPDNISTVNYFKGRIRKEK